MTGSGSTLFALYPSPERLGRPRPIAVTIRAASSPALASSPSTSAPTRRRTRMKRAHRHDGAPGRVGAYSQAIDAGGLVFCAGQVGIDPATGELVEGASRPRPSASCQPGRGPRGGRPRRCADVVKTTCFLPTSATSRRSTRSTRGSSPTRRPARSTFPVAALPHGARVEIEAIAVRPDGALTRLFDTLRRPALESRHPMPEQPPSPRGGPAAP